MKLSSTPLPGDYCFWGEGLEYTRKITRPSADCPCDFVRYAREHDKHTDKKQLDEQYSKSIQ